MSVAAPLILREGDRPRLEAMLRSSSIRAGLASRARIVLLAADGLPNAEVARRTGISRPTVVDWRGRYDAGGITPLHDQNAAVARPRSTTWRSWSPPSPRTDAHPSTSGDALVGPATGHRAGDLRR